MSDLQKKILKTLNEGEVLTKVGKIEDKKIFSKLELKCKCGSDTIYKQVIYYSFSKNIGEERPIWKKFNEEYLIKKYCGACGEKYGF